jgi:PAS domain S-box-containing protein
MTEIPHTKILILEHDPNDLELLLHTLKKSELHYTTEVVETRAQYVSALHSFVPDIILSDFSLPAFDGLSAFHIRQDVCPQTPLIIVSGTIGEENAVELIKKGVTDYVLKDKMYQVIPKIQRALKEAEERLRNLRAQQELAKNAELTQNILESITDAFVSVDRNWIVKYWNKEAEIILGMKRADIMDKNFLDVYLETISIKFYTEIHQVMNGGPAASFEDFVEPLNIWLRVNVYPSSNGISVYFKDITEAKRIENVNNLQKEVFEHYTAQGSTIESTIRLLIEGIGQIHPDLRGTLSKPRDGRLWQWGYTALPQEYIEGTEGMEIAVGSGCCGTAAYLKRKVESSDIATDPLWKTYKDLAGKHGLKACVAYPIIDPYQKLLGIFAVYLEVARSLTAAESATMETAKYAFQHIMDNFIAEEAVKLSEEKYRELFHLHPLPLWLFDAETYRFLDVNEAALHQYGYSREEFLEMTISDIRPPEDLELLRQDLELAKAAGSRLAGVFRHRKKDGEMIYAEVRSNEFDYQGKKARLIMANDITEKIKAEQRLALSEQRFKALVQEGSDLISIIALDGTYKYASPALAAMIGKDPESVIGVNAFHLIHPDDHEMITNAMNEIVLGKRVQTLPFRYKDHAGNYRWLQSIGTNLLDDPAVEGVVVNSKDITESINHIHAIEEQNTRLREISWIQSHIVRAPLSRIMGLVNLITDNPETEKANPEFLGYLSTSAHELDGIIRDIVQKTERVDDAALPEKPKKRKHSRIKTSGKSNDFPGN